MFKQHWVWLLLWGIVLEVIGQQGAHTEELSMETENFCHGVFEQRLGVW